MVGWRLAHYEIDEHLGSGGMGDVYRATDTKLGRTVALKFLRDDVAADPGRIARFRGEAKALAALNHPHIAAIHGQEDAEGRTFLVMEFVPGQTLETRIGGKPLPPSEAIAIALQIIEALEAAHDHGIVHRDLKPANVKITPDDRVKVLDFGLAKVTAGNSVAWTADASGDSTTVTLPSTRVGVILGTPAYMSPEQANGRPVDRRTDLFAFGGVLFEMLTGRRAFGGGSAADVMSRVLQREPDWTLLPSGVPPSLERLLRLCLEKDPRLRRQSAGDVRVDLERVQVEPPPAVPARAASRWLRNPAWIAITVAAITAPTEAILPPSCDCRS
jgi:serine/threonine protein kinase